MAGGAPPLGLAQPAIAAAAVRRHDGMNSVQVLPRFWTNKSEKPGCRSQMLQIETALPSTCDLNLHFRFYAYSWRIAALFS